MSKAGTIIEVGDVVKDGEIIGKRLWEVEYPEPPASDVINVKLLKKLAGGESISIRDLRTEEYLKKWFNFRLKVDPAFKLKMEKLRVGPLNGKLVYYDWTACSASHATSFVYLLPTGKYVVETESGMDCGDHKQSISSTECSTFVEILDELTSFSGHDPNDSGVLNLYVTSKLKKEYPEVKDRFVFFKDFSDKYPKFNLPKHLKNITDTLC